ncbi:MAG: hypothetical protein GEV07_09480 [Streptosporangiales bacterium]|nr:hypothetical protein [Streptosporangiales bacterium]
MSAQPPTGDQPPPHGHLPPQGYGTPAPPHGQPLHDQAPAPGSPPHGQLPPHERATLPPPHGHLPSHGDGNPPPPQGQPQAPSPGLPPHGQLAPHEHGFSPSHGSAAGQLPSQVGPQPHGQPPGQLAPHGVPPLPPGPPPAGGWRRFRERVPFSKALLTAVIGAVGGFVLSLSYSATSTTNGVLTSCTYVDAGPLLLAPVAAVAGLVAVVRCRRPGRELHLEVGAGLLCVAIAGLHVLRGLGIVGGPC